MLQTPEDYCRSIESPLLLRRNDDKSISTKFEAGINAKSYLKQLKHIRALANHNSGIMLMDTLNSFLDLERYFRWLSFNYLVMNGDYTDELFFFLEPEINKLYIIPWDYDDVFKAGPHEGSSKRDHLLGDKLIFSSETTLDMMIAKDRHLYEAYQKTFLDILTTLSETVIKEVFEQVYQELTPYYLDETIISQSRHDMSGRTDLEKLQNDLNHHFQFLIRRRRTIYETLMLNR
jgi:spore coat protein CotH